MKKETNKNLKPPFKKGDASRPKGSSPRVGGKNKPATKADLNHQLKGFASHIDDSLSEIKDQLKSFSQAAR